MSLDASLPNKTFQSHDPKPLNSTVYQKGARLNVDLPKQWLFVKGIVHPKMKILSVFTRVGY